MITEQIFGDPMYHPTTRVLTVLELLQTRGQISGAELAARLEVDRRTVRRYIAMLHDMGVPIEAIHGPGGGYRLRPSFKLPPLMLTNSEALAVTLSLMNARRQGSFAEPSALEGVLAKIERVLPEVLRARVQALESSVHFVPMQGVLQPPSETVLLLSTAVQKQCRVQLHYHSRGKVTQRDLDPYGLVLHWGFWYTVGWCHLRHNVRVFRLDRIEAIELTDTTFERPEAFDVLAYVLESLPNATQGWDIDVLLETTLLEAKRRIPPGTASLVETTQGVVMRAPVERLDWMARQLLMLEFSFVIREPPELREALRKVAGEALAFAERR
jgi:predicted DNA-binding transcriptional regulator YafY